jgi:hypothetical protein
LILYSVVYRDVTRQAKGLYRLKHVGALRSGLAYLSRYNSGWFCHNVSADEEVSAVPRGSTRPTTPSASLATKVEDPKWLEPSPSIRRGRQERTSSFKVPDGGGSGGGGGRTSPAPLDAPPAECEPSKHSFTVRPESFNDEVASSRPMEQED